MATAAKNLLDEKGSALERVVAALAKKTGTSLAELSKETVHVVDVVRHGQQITLPENMSIEEAMKTLERKRVHEEQMIQVDRTFNFGFYDGAYALIKVLEEKYGFADSLSSFFSTPAVSQIQVSPTLTVSVQTGLFKIPGIHGEIYSTFGHKNDQHVFELKAFIMRKHEEQIKEIGDLVIKYVAKNSIYRGKALRISTAESSAHPCGAMAEPEIIDLHGIKENELIFSKEVGDAIETNVFTPIVHAAECAELGIPFKRTVLFAGRFGTGKTLAAMVTAKKATDNGITFIYCEAANQLADVIEFAKQYGRAVIFCEDIDKALDGNRNEEMDELLNVVDGISSKNSEIMVILTTNEVQNIHPAMMRPGRIDAIINVKAPDAEAAQRLVRLYGRGLIPTEADLSQVGNVLNGQIPAVIRECVERAKLSAIRLGKKDNFTGKLYIDQEALLDASSSMKMQLDLLNQKKEPVLSDLEKAAKILAGSGTTVSLPNILGKSLTNGHASLVPTP